MTACSHSNISREQMLYQVDEDALGYSEGKSHNTSLEIFENGSWIAEKEHLNTV